MKKKSTLPLGLWLILLSFFSPATLLRAQSWEQIDSFQFPPPGSLDSIRVGLRLALDAGGLPYMVYQDAGSGLKGTLSAKKYNGSTWAQAGAQAFASSSQGLIDATVARNGIVYAAVDDGGPLPEVYAYNGSAWSPIGAPPPTPATSNTTMPSIAADSAATPYCALYDAETHNPVVFVLSSGIWTVVGPSELGNGTGGRVVQLAFDHHNTPYIVYDEANPSGAAPFLVVEKYNGGAWTKIGTSSLFSTGSNHVLAFDGQDIPNVITSTGDLQTGYNFKIVKLAGGDWIDATPLVLPAPVPGHNAAAHDPLGNIAQIYLSMGPHNTPFIGYYQDSANNVVDQIKVVKFNGAGWVPAGNNSFFDQGPVSVNMMTFSADTLGNAYVSYMHELQYTLIYKLVRNNSPTITFNDVFGSYGQADFSPGATSTNTDPGDPIIYTIEDTTIATIVDGKIHVLKPGATNITASQPGDSAWSAATPVQVRLFIVPASQTISFPGFPEKKVGDPDFPGGAIASSGLPVIYTGSDPTIATVSQDGNIHILEAGAIIVTASQPGDNNHQATGTVAQVLIIHDADSTPPNPSAPQKDSLHTWSSSSSTLTVEIWTLKNEQARLELYDMYGQRVYNQIIQLSSKGTNQFQVPIYRLRAGIYYVKVTGQHLQLIEKVWLGIR
jgi:hypothetical protein